MTDDDKLCDKLSDKKLKGINPMGLSSPRVDFYLNNRKGPPKFDHLNLPIKPINL